MWRRLRPERGSVTVLSLGLMVGLFTIVLVVATALDAIVKIESTQSAADLTALSVAQQLRAFRADPCEVASHYAHGNHAKLVSCTVTGTAVMVVVEPMEPIEILKIPTTVMRKGARAGLVFPLS